MNCSTMSGEEIVITGIAGKFPNSENVTIFQKNLLNMENLLSDKKPNWKTGNLKFPEKSGQITGTNCFDAQSFGIHKKFAECMDPISRLLLQCSYESVADAGINPRLLKGKKIAVFTGSGSGELEQNVDYDRNEANLMGSARAMFANRISFFLGLQGPSANINSENIASATALEMAYLAIKNGEVEGAIVGGGNLTLYPFPSLHYLNLGLLSPDGLTKSFDESANGYGRSEAIVVIFLQRARDAKRIYAEIKNIHTRCAPSYERLSVLYPTSHSQNELIQLTLKECGLSGKDISFVEADGLGIKEADIEEIKAIDQAFNEGRKTPLLIGSVKSNVGSCHAVNTLVSIVKLITMMESGYIPPNLHYTRSSEQMSAIREGRIQVVTDLIPWDGDYAAINSTSIGGGFASVILRSFKKEKNILQPKDNLPRLIMVSGVTEDAVNTILDYVETKPVNLEVFQLINDVFEVEDKSHLYRGYTLLTPSGIVTPKCREVKFVSGANKEIWYIFSGMGSQWVGMGKSLMNLSVFAESVRKCDAVLKPHGIDIINILTADDPHMFDNIINSFVGIITIQIGLVDILNYLGIKPDFIIGHSVGELGCAYADGCLTAEEAVLNAMFRGFASVETEMPKGLMAAVGLGYKKVKLLCPPDIDVACHNSAESSTISGPVDSMKSFISSLQGRGIFAKEVQTSNIAYHSRYISPAGPKLMEYLQKIMPDAKERSHKWISTSVPRNEWNTSRARLSSAEYYTNNLLSPVLFEEETSIIPKNAVTIEIAPHGLLQAILKRSLPEAVTNLSLTKRGHPNNIEMVIDAIGKLYINSGSRALISKLFSKIDYPVSPGTPSVSSLIRWGLSEIWSKDKERLCSMIDKTTEKTYNIDLSKESWKFLKGYKIRNENIFPCSLYFKFVLSAIKGFNKSKESILFENVIMHTNQCINEYELLQLTVMVQPGSGNFEVTANGTLVCSGILRKIDSFEQKQITLPNSSDNSNKVKRTDVYNQLILQGYQYSEPFKTICKFNSEESFGYIFYQENWYLFLEGMLQMYLLKYSTRTTKVPIKIRKLIIDLDGYENQFKLSREIPVIILPTSNIIRSCGMELHDVQITPIKQDLNLRSANVEEMKFTLNFEEALTSPLELTKIVLQLLNENNVPGDIIQLIEEDLSTLDKSPKSWKCIFEETLGNQFTFKLVSTSMQESSKYANTVLKIIFNTRTLTKINLLRPVEEDFILAILDSPIQNLKLIENLDLRIILRKRLIKNKVALLLRKKRLLGNAYILEITDKDFVVTDQIKRNINSPKLDRIIISSRLQHSSSKCEMFNVRLSEEIKNKIRYFEILDSMAPNLSLEETFYQKQLELDLKFNILTADGKWGFRKQIPIDIKRLKVANSVAFQTRPGDPESFDWVEQSCNDNEYSKLITVEYSTINTYDVLLASGNANLIPNEKYCKSKKIKHNTKLFGLEYSGTTSNGDRIMGLSGSGTICSFTALDSELNWEVPKTWTMEEAATVPLAYTAAYVALYLKGQIEKKNSIFIYDSSCAIGQAAISLALSENLQVFSTYRTEKEKQLLLIQYPTLNKNQLFCLEHSFDDEFLIFNKGARVDLLIYNSHNMDGFQSCLKCVKDVQGRFIIIGQLQESFEKSVGMFVFLEHFSMYSIIPHNLVNADLNTKKQLSSMIKNGLSKGVVKPIFSNLYSRDKLKEAFINASCNLCFGKTVIKVQPLDSNVGQLVIPRFSCLKNRIYLLIIDNWENWFGVKFIDFLIEHGANTILVVSTTTDASKAIYNHNLEIWKENETKVIFRDNMDLSEYSDVKILLNETLKFYSIDAIFDLQRMTTFSEKSVYLKNSITKNLFEESKNVCKDLRHFKVFVCLNETDDDFNVYLFKESNFTTFFKERSNDTFQAQLILWNRIEELDQSRSSSIIKNPLTLHQCIQELDRVMTLTEPYVVVSNKSNITRKTKSTTNVKDKSEKELFENYIFNRVRSTLI